MLLPTRLPARRLVRWSLSLAICSALSLTGLTETSAGAGAAVPLSTAGDVQAASTPSWVMEINRYRLVAGLVPVVDQPAWDAGLAAHIRYLELSPAGYRTGAYASAHTENPASPYYTAAGAQEAASSDLELGGDTGTAVHAIDVWLTEPFHAVGMLRPALRQVAFAEDPLTGYAALDVISGLDQSAPLDPLPAMFPGNGMLTNLLTDSPEGPDPLQTCGWSGQKVGLPLVVLLPQPPAPGLTATLAGPGGRIESTSAGTLCVVDDITYRSSDPLYGPTGAAILSGGNAVFLIPRQPLGLGGFRATVFDPGRAALSWTFSTALTVLPDIASGITLGPGGGGYWLTDPAGAISPHGDVRYYGSTAGIPLNRPIVGMAATPDGNGYWLIASDGGIFPFGDARFYGSTGNIRLNQPIVGMAVAPKGLGYWLVASDGGIFPFGPDAHFYGSTGNIRLNRPIVGMAATPDGNGYWLVASDGGIFPFGPGAHFYGSTGNIRLNRPVVGMAVAPKGLGYWLVASDGGIFPFGQAPFHGSLGATPLPAPIQAMAPSFDGNGYYLVGADGTVYPFGDARWYGND